MYVILKTRFLGKELRIQQRKHTIVLILLSMNLVYALMGFDPVEACKQAMLPILKTTLSEFKDMTAGTSTKICQMTLSPQEKIVTNEPPKPRMLKSFGRQMVMQAKEDLARRLSVEVDRINLIELREVTWPDSSLGCPQPGVVYAQEPQEGLLIRLSVDKDMYFYHSGGTQTPFLCEATSQVVPKVTPKTDEFVPPPDSEID